MKTCLWLLAGFALAIVLTTGTLLILVTLPTPPLLHRPTTPHTICPHRGNGGAIQGRAEAHLYDMEISSGSLSAGFDASIPEGFVGSIVARKLAKMGKEGGLPAGICIIESPRIDFQEDASA